MIDINSKICSRTKSHIEGEEYSDGSIVSFKYGFKQCDRCMDRGRRERNKYVRKREESSRMRVPFEKGVYSINHGDEIVYIGYSDSVGWRLSEHFNKGAGHSILAKNGINRLVRELEYSWNILWHGDSIEYARHQEKMLIQAHQPKFNKIKYKNYEG